MKKALIMLSMGLLTMGLGSATSAITNSSTNTDSTNASTKFFPLVQSSVNKIKTTWKYCCTHAIDYNNAIPLVNWFHVYSSGSNPPDPRPNYLQSYQSNAPVGLPYYLSTPSDFSHPVVNLTDKTSGLTSPDGTQDYSKEGVTLQCPAGFVMVQAMKVDTTIPVAGVNFNAGDKNSPVDYAMCAPVTMHCEWVEPSKSIHAEKYASHYRYLDQNVSNSVPNYTAIQPNAWAFGTTRGSVYEADLTDTTRFGSSAVQSLNQDYYGSSQPDYCE